MNEAKLKANVAAVEQQYRAATPRSAQLFERALQSLPGGNTRTTIYMQPYPFYFDHGKGYTIYDIDDNERIDFINNYTSLILGHCYPTVVAAVQRQAARGMCVTAPTEMEIELAEELKQRLASIEHIRFTNSGTEATMLALRAARAFTGRAKIAKFDVGYHGSHDYVALDPSAMPTTTLEGPTTTNGIPSLIAETVITLPYNDREGVERILSRHHHELAALIVEPVMGVGGVLLPQEGFLSFLRQITQSYGIVLIFDEVMAFRLSYHGAQGYFGITPDLTTLGKIIGGGLPIGAFGGRAEIMDAFDPRRATAIIHGGTFNGNPASMAAGLATLHEMTLETYTHLNALGAELKTKLEALFASLNISAQVNQIGSLFNLHFSNTPVTDYATISTTNRQWLKGLYLAALNHGIVFTPRGMGCLSTVMTSAQVDLFVRAIQLGLYDLGVA
jgi:glutamate-1-semialdehyde 2,1-aminomutase